MTQTQSLFKQLLIALRDAAVRHRFLDETVPIRCRPLKPEEAIGKPKDQDYPLLKGKEVLVEAIFKEARGHAFADEYENAIVKLSDLLEDVPDTTKKRVQFVAVLNAVWRHLELAEKTEHCKDEEPVECAQELITRIDPGMRVLMVGLQPRLLEYLVRQNPVRCLDLDPDNIGQERFGVTIEGADKTEEGIEWCHMILATGSTLVNGSMPQFLNTGKPVVFFGVTIAAAAGILGLDRFCHMGH